MTDAIEGLRNARLWSDNDEVAQPTGNWNDMYGSNDNLGYNDDDEDGSENDDDDDLKGIVKLPDDISSETSEEEDDFDFNEIGAPESDEDDENGDGTKRSSIGTLLKAKSKLKKGKKGKRRKPSKASKGASAKSKNENDPDNKEGETDCVSEKNPEGTENEPVDPEKKPDDN